MKVYLRLPHATEEGGVLVFEQHPFKSKCEVMVTTKKYRLPHRYLLVKADTTCALCGVETRAVVPILLPFSMSVQSVDCKTLVKGKSRCPGCGGLEV